MRTDTGKTWTRSPGDLPREGDDHDLFYGQTKWIVGHRDSHAIVAAVHNGDIVDKATVVSQWAIADKAIRP